ncbi:Uncharacterized conserved protein, DUF4415 family [Ectothiorhodosinus mongolicus]|uniref:Uncharacterized conserved protein, DUF4415 family n=2 Tax=Ectothiorhodosinus mongolicus TaxID=233100 RepID=A0A1R3VU15_9GAMM|nr:Uncharacterized conserved protein, DUF4415 family [Ectothiorhodosinus mongolicus]
MHLPTVMTNKITKQQADELRALMDKSEDDIDTKEQPEITDWTGAERGKFYRPIKQQVTLRLDADLLAWFKSRGSHYQTRINAALRQFIEEHPEKR